MTKRVRVGLFGFQKRSVLVDADATEGAVVGQDLRWPDGTLITEAELKNRTQTVVNQTSSVGSSSQSSLWSLLIGVPAIISSLGELATNGWIRNDGDTVTAFQWPFNKTSVEDGEELTIPDGHELIVFDSFTMDGEITLDGDLVILQ